MLGRDDCLYVVVRELDADRVVVECGEGFPKAGALQGRDRGAPGKGRGLDANERA